MSTDLKKIGESYFNSWEANDYETMRSIFSEDVTFIGALGVAHGVEECLNGLRGLSSIITKIDIQHMWADENDIITWYEMHTSKTSKPLPIVNWSHVENGLITEIRVTFDPRPLLGG